MNNNNFDWPRYIKLFADCFPNRLSDSPWQITSGAADVIAEILSSLSLDYSIKDGVAIHRSAILENNITVKAPAIIGSNCFIAGNCYLRGGVYLLSHNSIGPGCEIKSSLIFPHTNLAHFNFIGDSIVGSNINFEAGSITANHFNERESKNISVLMNGQIVDTKQQKFGALVGDGSKIGANAVLSPGTILEPSSIVRRLELVDQLK